MTNQRYMTTASGRKVFIPHPLPGQIVIEDVALHLARVRRFVGACPRYFCPTLDQRVLTQDLRWKRIGDIAVGERLVGFDEYPVPTTAGGKRRHYRPSVVTHLEPRKAMCLRFHMSDGSSVTSSVDHPWLVVKSPGSAGARGGKNSVWRKAQRIAELHAQGNPQHMRRYLNPWVERRDYVSGWVAGMFDGEGHFSNRPTGGFDLAVSQNEGPLLEKLKIDLSQAGYQMRVNKNPNSDCVTLTVGGGVREYLRLLGEYRPMRLLAKADMDGKHFVDKHGSLSVVAVENVGEEWVAGIETSTHTYLCEGFAAHNSVAQHSVIVGYLAIAVDRTMGGNESPGLLMKHSLLHDGAEYLTNDVPSPVKALIGDGFRRLTKEIDRAICNEFDLGHIRPASVYIADKIALELDSAILMKDQGGVDLLQYVPEAAKVLHAKLQGGGAGSSWYRMAVETTEAQMDEQRAYKQFMSEWNMAAQYAV